MRLALLNFRGPVEMLAGDLAVDRTARIIATAYIRVPDNGIRFYSSSCTYV